MTIVCLNVSKLFIRNNNNIKVSFMTLKNSFEFMETVMPYNCTTNTNTIAMTHIWKTIFYTSQSVIGLTTNIFVVIVILRSKKLSKLDFAKFLVNQSFIDGTSCVMLMFSYFSLHHFNMDLNLTEGYFLDEVICRVWVNDLLLWGFLISSTYHLVMMSLQKYGQIVHPIRHRKCCQGRWSWITMVLPWLFGPTYCIVTLSGKARIRDGKCIINVWTSQTTGRILGTVVVMVQFVIPMVIIVLCYTQILTTIRRRWRPVFSKADPVTNGDSVTDSIGNDVNNHQQQLIKPKSQSKLLRGVKIQKNIIQTLTIICVCFFLCWVTNTIVFFTINIGIVPPTIYNTWLFEFSVIAVYANSVINPFIYMIEFKPFRDVMIKSIRKQKYQGSSTMPLASNSMLEGAV